jgi:hypothetical protein
MTPWLASRDELKNQASSRVVIAEGIPCPTLSPLKAAALKIRAELIPGWCSEEKIDVFLDVFRYVPKGDIIEIGVWCGKSASVLAGLGRIYGTGPLLCVDPWTAAAAIQENATINPAMAEFNYDDIHDLFCMALSAVEGGGGVNYLRASSNDAAKLYTSGLTVSTEMFGRTTYSGSVALLHVDGNHDLDQVTRDLALWTPHIAPGGWLVVDDYTHAFGDGPRHAADNYVNRHANHITSAFVAGTALFVQHSTTWQGGR